MHSPLAAHTKLHTLLAPDLCLYLAHMPQTHHTTVPHRTQSHVARNICIMYPDGYEHEAMAGCGRAAGAPCAIFAQLGHPIDFMHRRRRAPQQSALRSTLWIMHTWRASVRQWLHWKDVSCDVGAACSRMQMMHVQSLGMRWFGSVGLHTESVRLDLMWSDFNIWYMYIKKKKQHLKGNILIFTENA